MRSSCTVAVDVAYLDAAEACPSGFAQGYLLGVQALLHVGATLEAVHHALQAVAVRVGELHGAAVFRRGAVPEADIDMVGELRDIQIRRDLPSAPFNVVVPAAVNPVLRDQCRLQGCRVLGAVLGGGRPKEAVDGPVLGGMYI